jgi:hypothetical protein
MRKKLYYKTKEGDYESLDKDAADLYLFRKSNLQAHLDSHRFKITLVISACTIFSILLFLFY